MTFHLPILSSSSPLCHLLISDFMWVVSRKKSRLHFVKLKRRRRRKIIESWEAKKIENSLTKSKSTLWLRLWNETRLKGWCGRKDYRVGKISAFELCRVWGRRKECWDEGERELWEIFHHHHRHHKLLITMTTRAFLPTQYWEKIEMKMWSCVVKNNQN